MRLLLLSADVGNSMPNTGDYFITHAIEKIFDHEECFRLPLHQRPRAADLAFAQACDALIICGTNIVGADDRLRCGWTLEDFRAVNRPVIPLGLGSQADRGNEVSLDEEGQQLLAYWFESSGKISVRDELTFKAMEKFLGKGSAELTGCPSTFFHTSHIVSLPQHTLFCPPPFHYRSPWMGDENFPRNLIQRTFELLKERRSLLYLAQQPSDLLFDVAEPGWRTLYSPLYPKNHLRLIRAAREIVSFRIHPCLVGIANGCASLLLSLDARTQSLAETYGIPYLCVTPTTHGEEILEMARQTFAAYPWKTVHQRLAKQRENLKAHLEEKGLLREKTAQRKGESAYTVCCITDRSHFGRFLGLYENLQSKSPGARFHVLFLDEESRGLAKRHIGEKHFSAYRLSELWDEEEIKTIKRRSVAEVAYSSKPRLLKVVIEKTGSSALFCDTDLFFFESPASLFGELGDSEALLFPHWNDQAMKNRWHGLYNSGLFAASPRGLEFLDWWSKMCLRYWGKSRSQGTYYEQAFLDHAPLHFSGIAVYRKGDHNVGPWNIESLGVELPVNEPWRPRLVNGKTLKSFHAASADPLGLFEMKNSWDQVTCLAHGIPLGMMAEDFREWLVTSQGRYWPALKRVLFLFQTLRYRFGMKVPFPPDEWLSTATRGHVGKTMALFSALYTKTRDGYRFASGKPLRPEELLTAIPLVESTP